MQEELCNCDLLVWFCFVFFSPRITDKECAFKKLQANAWTWENVLLQ